MTKNKRDLRTTVTIPEPLEQELAKIVKEVKEKLPLEISRKISVAFVITMIVRNWIYLYKKGKITINDLLEAK